MSSNDDYYDAFDRDDYWVAYSFSKASCDCYLPASSITFIRHARSLFSGEVVPILFATLFHLFLRELLN